MIVHYGLSTVGSDLLTLMIFNQNSFVVDRVWIVHVAGGVDDE